MKQLRGQWSWPTLVAPLIFGTALAVVVASCGSQPNSANPLGASSIGSLAIETTPSPSPSPSPSPEPSPSPTPGTEGCTPGYWKQDQHFDSWTGYTPGQSFLSAFGVNAFPGMSLLDVLNNGGGGLDALGRHAVAALLNSTSAGVDYPLSTAQVISAFQSAYASGNYEAQKNIFAGYNELGCPIN